VIDDTPDLGVEDGEGDHEGGRVKVELLVREFLSAQTLSVLEENGLGEAIESYVDKDDKRALQDFIEDTLKEHVEVHIPRDLLNPLTHPLAIFSLRRFYIVFFCLEGLGVHL